MRKFTSLLLSTMLSATASSTIACEAPSNAQTGDRPYLILRDLDCGEASHCYLDITDKRRFSIRPDRYRVYYIPQNDNGMRSGLVVGQYVYPKMPLNNDKLHVKRDKITFACKSPRSRQVHTIRTEAEKVVSYKKYDRYHRFGSPIEGEDYEFFINELHVKYDNGFSCVASGEGARRERFLFDRRDDLPTILRIIANRISGRDAAGSALAGEDPKREVFVRPIEFDQKGRGCVSFNLDGSAAEEIKLQIDYLENKLPRGRRNDIQRVVFFVEEN